MIALLLLALLPQTDLTPEEKWASVVAVHLSAPPIFYKAPIDAALTPVPVPALPAFTLEPVRTKRLQFELDYAHGNAEPEMAPIEDRLRVVSADDERPMAITPNTRLIHAQWGQVVSSGARMTVAFSSGLTVGKGVLSWRATACNMTDIPQPADQGDIETAAISTGIPVVGYGEAQDTNRLARNNSTPVRSTQIVQGGAGIMTVLIASRLVAASGAWGAAAGIVMYGAGRLVTYLQSVSPADLSTRFTGTTILADGASVMLPPRSSQNHCGTWEFFARYSNNAVPPIGSPARAARAGIRIY